MPTPEQVELEALRLEVRLQGVMNQVIAKCPDLVTIYDLPENGARMAKWLESQNPPLPFTVENLVLAFNKNKHLFARVETEEDQREKANREYRDKSEQEKADARAKREREQNKQQPLSHISHTQLERERQQAEVEQENVRKALRTVFEKARQGVTREIPTIYFPERTEDGRMHPLRGKVDWQSTYAERKRLGFDVEAGGKTNIKLKGE